MPGERWKNDPDKIKVRRCQLEVCKLSSPSQGHRGGKFLLHYSKQTLHPASALIALICILTARAFVLPLQRACAELSDTLRHIFLTYVDGSGEVTKVSKDWSTGVCQALASTQFVVVGGTSVTDDDLLSNLVSSRYTRDTAIFEVTFQNRSASKIIFTLSFSYFLKKKVGINKFTCYLF